MISPARPVRIPRRIVELRIHGVSGTPPESMLRTVIDDELAAADVEQVAGDTLTGFYRVKAATHAPDPDHVLEAYNWGQLTSGTWRKSLWLLLVPFGLLNAAHFMLPKAGNHASAGGRLLSQTAEALLRVLGLVMTAAFTLGLAAALIDLVGWQWTALPSSGHGAADPRFADPRGVLAAAMVVAALIPMAVLLFGGFRSPGAGEPVAPIPPPAEQPAVAATTGLVGPEFAVGYPTIASLQRLHFAVVAGLLAYLGLSVYRQDGGATSDLGRWLERNGANACTIVLIGVTVLALCFGNPHRAGNKLRLLLVSGASWLALAVALLLWSVAGICVLASRTIPPTGRGPLPGLPGLCNALMVIGLAAILLLALITALLAAATRKTGVPRPFRRYLLGMIGVVMAAIAVFVGVGLASAFVYGTRYVLLRTTAAGTDLSPPLIVDRLAHAWGVTTVELLLIGLVLLGLWALQRATFVTRVRTAHNVHPYADTDVEQSQDSTTGYTGLRHPDDLTPSAVDRVATAWWLARIKYRLQWILVVLAVFGVLLGTLTAFALAHDNGVPVWRIFSANAATVCLDTGGPAASPLVGWTVSCTGYGGPFFAAAGAAVLLGLAAALVYLGRKSMSDNGLRRSVNVVWDIIAFWPRAAHPLVPPPYTAKALDELRRRIYFHLGRCAMPAWHRAVGCTCARSATPADQVVLAPHSQGSLLALAAIAGLRLQQGPTGPGPLEESPFRPIEPGELGMVSYGSQLQFAYARAFPAYVNYPLIKGCAALFRVGTQSRWINLLRETDPIGGQVFSDERDLAFHSRTLRTDFEPGEPKELDTRPDGDESARGVRISGHLEWRLLDPVPTDAQNARRWPILAHSDYFLDPAWAAVIAHVSAADAEAGSPTAARAGGALPGTTGRTAPAGKSTAAARSRR